jgi:hypothetical protein
VLFKQRAHDKGQHESVEDQEDDGGCGEEDEGGHGGSGVVAAGTTNAKSVWVHENVGWVPTHNPARWVDTPIASPLRLSPVRCEASGVS